MKYEDYIKQRKALTDQMMDGVDNLTDEEYNNLKDQVDALDNKWDAAQDRLANIKALSDNQRTLKIDDLAGVNPEGLVGGDKASFVPQNNADANDPAKMFASEEYKTAWAKSMMGKKLTDAEQNMVHMVNEFTHTTENTGIVIPETVAQGIWDLVDELYPIWDNVSKTYVKGNYTAIISDTSTDAKWYDEATATEDGTEALSSITLSGCELSRAITVSWKLRDMAMDDFIPFIQRKMAKKIGAALGYGVTHGAGKVEGQKPEPTGIITALNAEASTPQVVEYTSGSLAYSDLTAARSKVSVAANELAIYANAATIWSELANVVDADKRPIMIPDPTASGVQRIFGLAVNEDDSLADGEILFGALETGYIANVNRDMSVLTEEHVKARTVDYCGYAIVDGAVTTTKAFALLKKKATA